ISAEAFWDGLDGADALKRMMADRAGVAISTASDACRAALACYRGVKRIAVLTPYMPEADERVGRYFEDCGFSVARLTGLRCRGPVLIAHVSQAQLRDAIVDIDGDDVDAIVQVGTNLAMARLAGIAEFWLGKPVIAVNAATYWWALRQHGISDRLYGFGTLLEQH
ncbi:MAG: Asp/Glu racemase, partial [Parvibaculaceae bacterium]